MSGQIHIDRRRWSRFPDGTRTFLAEWLGEHGLDLAALTSDGFVVCEGEVITAEMFKLDGLGNRIHDEVTGRPKKVVVSRRLVQPLPAGIVEDVLDEVRR